MGGVDYSLSVNMCDCLRCELSVGVGADVQRRIGARKPSSGGGVQAAAGARMRCVPQSAGKVAPAAQTDGHRNCKLLTLFAF